MIILNTTDFLPPNGNYFYKIAQDDSNTGVLQQYIDKWEKKWIHTILGQPLGDLFIAALTPVPPAQPTGASGVYANIFAGISINDANDGYALRYSEGFKNILMAKVYFEYIKDGQYKNTMTGLSTSDVDTEKRLSYQNVYMAAENKFNDSIEWIRCVQWYCLIYDPTDFPNFYGQIIDAESSAFL